MSTPPLPRRSARPKRVDPRMSSREKVIAAALLSITCFLAALAVLWVFLAKVELLTRLGLDGKLYYLVLLPLGLAVAGSLFGVLRSYGYYRGHLLGGVLELGGPVVVFCLVVLGGFWLVPSPATFSVTVFVHGEGGLQDVPLRGRGIVVMDLGGDRRREHIGDKGEAHFAGIPPIFRGQPVALWPDAEGFAPADPDATHVLTAGSLYLAVKRKAVAIRGRVQDAETRPIAGASLRIRELAATSTPDGAFVFEIPGAMAGEHLTLDVSAAGYAPWHEQIVPSSNDTIVVLQKQPT